MENDTHTKNDHALNEPIGMEELQKAIKLIQKGKAVGVDNIPNEIIIMPSLQPILHKLFETCSNITAVHRRKYGIKILYIPF